MKWNFSCWCLLYGMIFLSAMANAHEGHDDSGFAPQYVTVSGTIEAIQADDFKGQKSSRQIFLIDDQTGARYELHFKGSAPYGFTKRQKAKIRGKQFSPSDIMVNEKEAQFAAANGSTTTSGSTGGVAAAAVSGDRKTLVLITDSNDNVAKCSATQVNDLFFNNPSNSINYMYRDASNASMSFSGVTYEHIKINVNSAGACDYSTWGNLALQAAGQMGIGTSGFNNIVYILPTGSACGWAGMGMLGSGTAWIKGEYCNMPDVSAHELGHNIGMHHARANGAEYGDVSDIMGYGGYGLRMLNAAHMDLMGWLPSSRTVVAGVGTYEITALESDPAAVSLPMVIKVANPTNGGYFYLSFRQRMGYDSNLNANYVDKLNIHTATGGYSDFLAALTDGGVYTDPASGMSVSVNSHTATSINFTVSGKCVANAPSLSITPSMQGATLGQTRSYTVTLTNRDGGFCNSSSFNMAGMMPTELSATVTPASLTLAPGASGSVRVDVTSSTAAASATYSFSVASSDPSGQALHAGSVSGQYVIDGIAPSVPLGLRNSTSKGRSVQLAWSAATDNVAVVAYDVMRNGVMLSSSTSSNSFSDSPGRGTFTYQVRARDAAGNSSAWSASITVKK